MCAQHVEQFFMPLDLGHTCHGLVSQMKSWFDCPQNIFVSQSSPHMTCVSLPIEYALDFKVVVCSWPFIERNL